jgi:hypothetical protein
MAAAASSASPLLLPSGILAHPHLHTARFFPSHLGPLVRAWMPDECSACHRAETCVGLQGVASRRQRVQEQGAELRGAVLLQGCRRWKRGAMRGGWRFLDRWQQYPEGAGRSGAGSVCLGAGSVWCRRRRVAAGGEAQALRCLLRNRARKCRLTG